ncbi:MAG TPA: ATP synthase F1 subunit delta [Candidatus Limnocylindria bacterium]|nr:ATP synthase F1 subunit delta [Candidatus Limnocylindria bacterium]
MANPGASATRRYAEAAFELATRDDALDAYGDGFDLAASMLAGDDVLSILRNPARPLSERIELVDTLLAKRVPDPVRKLVGLLVQRGKVDSLPNVVAEYRRLLNKERGVVEAVATTAVALDASETKALASKVAKMTGRTVDLRVEVDEALIGGLTVRVGDTLYDASVRGRLERLRERLVAGAR